MNKSCNKEETKKKIKGLKSAVGDYQWANSQGWWTPWYGKLMYDTDDGEIWTDTFYSLGHNEWKVYHSDTIICLSDEMNFYDIEVNMKNVREFIEKHYM